MNFNTQKINNQNIEKKPFKLRVVPWFTDGCSTFLSNLFKWLPQTLNKRMCVLEFGGGNSSFFFLSKGLKVVSVESDPNYIEFLINVARNTGFNAAAFTDSNVLITKMDEYDLLILSASKFADVSRLIDTLDSDIIVNDGIARREILDKLLIDEPDKIIILDNVEYAANWGRLDRSSAKPDLICVYRSFLRSQNWRHYIFEQAEGRSGHGVADKTGWESPHRWASAVSWQHGSLLSKLMVTNIGFPIINKLGEDDVDLDSLNFRCPFDWDAMKWVKSPFPPDLDLKLERDFE